MTDDAKGPANDGDRIREQERISKAVPPEPDAKKAACPHDADVLVLRDGSVICDQCQHIFYTPHGAVAKCWRCGEPFDAPGKGGCPHPPPAMSRALEKDPDALRQICEVARGPQADAIDSLLGHMVAGERPPPADPEIDKGLVVPGVSCPQCEALDGGSTESERALDAPEEEPLILKAPTLRSLLTGLKKHLDAGGSWAKLPPGDRRQHMTLPELESGILGRLLEEVDAFPDWSVFRDGTPYLEAVRKLLSEMPPVLTGSWVSAARWLLNSIRAADGNLPKEPVARHREATCPSCGALPGQPCRLVRMGPGDVMEGVHRSRARAASRADAAPLPQGPKPSTFREVADPRPPIVRLADRYPGLGLYLRDIGAGKSMEHQKGRRDFFASALLELADPAHREPGEAPPDPDPATSSGDVLREAVLRSGEGRIREDPDELAEEFRAKAESPRANPRYHLLVPAWLVREAADFLGAATDSRDLDQDLARELRAALHLNSAVPNLNSAVPNLDLDAAADRVIAARVRKGQPLATDLGKTVNGILEEGGEFARALRRGTVVEQADALLDLMVYCLGGLGILDLDVGRELAKVLDRNETRTHEGSH